MALKINKQNTNFSITKGFLLLFFQFCVHLRNPYKCTFPRIFYLLDPDRGGILLCRSGSETLLHRLNCLNSAIFSYNYKKIYLFNIYLTEIVLQNQFLLFLFKIYKFNVLESTTLWSQWPLDKYRYHTGPYCLTLL